MDRITASKVFVAIVEQGSMVKAADYLDMSRSMVTRYLAEMENWAQARLLHRSTRKLSLTNAGEQVLASCYQLQAIDVALQCTAEHHQEAPSGLLRIATSQHFGEHLLTPFLRDFLANYPKVSVDLDISNHASNLVEQGIDLAIRITNDLEPNLIARKLATLRSVVCVSKDYIQRRGQPKNLAQLSQHNCLGYSYFGHRHWRFTHPEGEKSVAISGSLSANDAAVLQQAAVLGVGIARLPRYAVQAQLDCGELVHLFPEYEPQTLGVYGVFQSRQYMPKALRCFIDELVIYMAAMQL